APRVRETCARLRLQLVAGEMLGPELDRVFEIGVEVCHGLTRDAVEEVEREIVEAGIAEERERAPYVRRLRTPLEHGEEVRAEALRAERDARHTCAAQRAGELRRHRLRVGLDRDLFRRGERLEEANELRERGERRRPAAEEDGLEVVDENFSFLLELPQERVDVRGVLLGPADRGDEVAVAAPVCTERQVHIEVLDVHGALLGRGTSSPPQLGQTCSSWSPQSAQNVHSKEQMTAAPSGASPAPQRSHVVRISRLMTTACSPGRC